MLNTKMVANTLYALYDIILWPADLEPFLHHRQE